MATDVKNEVLQMVQEIDDEQLLQLLKEDIKYLTEGKDITADLRPHDKEELTQLASEADEHETLNDDEFKNATAKWRIK